VKIDSENYTAQELQLFLNEVTKNWKTKQQYANVIPLNEPKISRKGVDKRLKSNFPPQTYLICGNVFIEDKREVDIEIDEPKLILKKVQKYF